MLVVLNTYINVFDAWILKGRLEAENIQVYLDYQHHVLANWAIAQAIEGVLVRVHAEQFERAWKIMQAHTSGEYVLETPLDDNCLAVDEPQCPRCHNQNSISSIWSVKLALLVVFLIKPPIPFIRRIRQCT